MLEQWSDCKQLIKEHTSETWVHINYVSLVSANTMHIIVYLANRRPNYIAVKICFNVRFGTSIVKPKGENLHCRKRAVQTAAFAAAWCLMPLVCGLEAFERILLIWLDATELFMGEKLPSFFAVAVTDFRTFHQQVVWYHTAQSPIKHHFNSLFTSEGRHLLRSCPMSFLWFSGIYDFMVWK